MWKKGCGEGLQKVKRKGEGGAGVKGMVGGVGENDKKERVNEGKRGGCTETKD